MNRFACHHTGQAGQQLDLSRLYTDGVIGVTAVPEPGSWVLMAIGLGLLACRHLKTSMT